VDVEPGCSPIRFQGHLKVYPKNGNIKQFNNKKQNIYCNADMFLQLSKSEAGPYAALDALLCGLVVISTNVGLFYKDVPETCFVKVQWKRMHDLAYVKSRILYGWKNRKTLAAKCKEMVFRKLFIFMVERNYGEDCS